MNFRNIVEGTDAFKKQNSVQRVITLKKQNLDVIEAGVKIATTIGLQQWEGQSNYNYLNKPIVQEIVTKKLYTMKPTVTPAAMLQFKTKGFVSIVKP